MMQNLDEILSERATQQYREKLTEILDPTSWTTENKDSKFAEIRKLSSDVADMGITFVKEMLDTELDDKSILYWRIKQEFIGAEIDILYGFRDELDRTLPEFVDQFPVDYDWLNENIKLRLMEQNLITNRIQEKLDSLTEVEEL